MFVTNFNSLGPHIKQYLIVIIANLSLLATGLGLAWTSPVLVKLTNSTSLVLRQPVTQEEGSWIVSVPFISGIISNFLAAFLIDRFGRKFCLILASLPRIGCYIFLYTAVDIWMIYVGRFLIGFADGFTFNVMPIYASEVASKEIRGGLGTIFQIFCSLGILLILSMGPFLDYFMLNLVVLIIVIATSLPLLILPDSPYYLYKKGNIKEAINVLTNLRGSTELAHEEIKEYQSSDGVEKVKLTEVLKSRTVLKSTLIVIILGAGAQFTGFNAISFYLQTILVSTKTSVSSKTASVIIGSIQLLASICTSIVIDKFGRKPILSVTLVGVSLGMLGLGTFFYITQVESEIAGALNYLPLVSLVLVVFCFSAGLGSLMMPLMSELFDGQARAIGMSFGLTSSIIALFIVSKFFAPLTTLIGPAVMYWIFSFNTLVICLFILFCVPETKGKTFSEIQAVLSRKPCDTENKS